MQYALGRGHECEIRISDISVSRFHARVLYDDGKFMLEDNTSKFGTLVQVKDKIPILRNHTCAVQSGRTVVTYMLKTVGHGQAQSGPWKSLLQCQDSQQIRKLNEYKEEHQNLNRIMSEAKNEGQGFNNQMNRPNMQFSMPNNNPPVTLPQPQGEFQEEMRDEEEENNN